MAEANPAISTFGLSKRYAGAQRYALKNLNLDVEPGEVYGFLGPNGAGKTTTIRLLMNFLHPSEGQAQILGRDIVADSVSIKPDIGYLPGEIALYPKMTGRQFLDYMISLQPPKDNQYLKKMVRLFDLDLDQKIGQLSKGNRQKLAIIQAFAHEPRVIILDEPTVGLDPLMQEVFFEVVRETKAKGSSLFISSHNLTEVQKICDRVGFIRNGRMIAEQTIADLNSSANQIFDIAFEQTVPTADLRSLPKSKIIANTSHHATVRVRGELTPLFRLLARHKVLSIDRRETSLEEEFLKFYKGKK